MKTIVLDQPENFRLGETNKPETIGKDEALLKVLHVGICGTDLHAFKGNQPFFDYPRILGHELAVEVVALGESTIDHNIHVGDICAVRPYLNCGECVSCRRGRTNACTTLKTLGVHTDGGMREFVTLPIDKLHIANQILPEHVALIEMLCIGAHAVRRAQLEPNENVLVIGAGPIGMGTAQFAREHTANVIMLDINEDRLAFCTEVMKFAHTLLVDEHVEANLRELCGGELPTVVFDATGNQKSMMQAFNYVAHTGKLVYVGLVKNTVTFDDPYFHSHELTLMSSRNATAEDFDHVIASLQQGTVSLDGWITHHATPQELVENFGDWTKPETGVIKALLSF